MSAMLMFGYLTVLFAPPADPPTCSDDKGNLGCQVHVNRVTKTCTRSPSPADGVSIIEEKSQVDGVEFSDMTGLVVTATVDGQPVPDPTSSMGLYPHRAGRWEVRVETDAGELVCTDSFTLAKSAKDVDERDADKPDHKSTNVFDANVAMLASEGKEWLVDKRGITGHEIARRGENEGTDKPPWGARVKLYFLPDGRPAFPIPQNLEETDVLTIAVVVPKGSGVDIVESSCPDLQLGRIRGSYTDAVGLLDLHGGAERPTLEPTWELIETGEFRCSDSLSLDIKVHNVTPKPSTPPDTKAEVVVAERSVEIPLDQVFFLTVGVGLVFDFGRPTITKLGERPVEGMPSETEKYVVQRNDFSGLRPVVTIGAHPCGANPRWWRPCDVFSPTLVLDPLRLDKGFGLGFNLTAPWFGVVIAANMYKSRVLSDDANIAIGETWTTPGDVPTNEVFDKNSFGAFIGFSLTTDSFRALTGKKK